MKKRGFTLIELLAVVAVLGVIILIAVPTINNTIMNTRKEQFETYRKNLCSAAETYVHIKNLELPAEIDVNDLKQEKLITEVVKNPISGQEITKVKINSSLECE